MTSEVMDPARGPREAAPHTTDPRSTRMSDLTSTIDTHLAAYAEPDATVRGPLLEQAWAPDGILLDPPLTGEGHAGLSAAADALQTQFAGHRFVRTSAVDEHHGEFRYAWELRSPDGTPVLAGTDVGAVAEDGRLARITGFFGELPAA